MFSSAVDSSIVVEMQKSSRLTIYSYKSTAFDQHGNISNISKDP